MEAVDPPDCDLRSEPTSPLSPPSITNDKSAKMLEDKVVHPAKRMWNSDADETVETTKRARVVDSLDNRHNDSAGHEKLMHTNAVPSVQNQDKDTNGEGNGDHLLQDTSSNGALDNTSVLVNSSKGAGLAETLDEPARETPGSTAETSPADARSASGSSTSAKAISVGSSAEEEEEEEEKEEEAMDVDSSSELGSAPATPKPSGLETSRTETTENSKSSLKPSANDTASGTESKAPTKDATDSDRNSPAGVVEKDEVSTPAGEKTGASASEQDTVKESGAEETPRTDKELENGDGTSKTSKTSASGSVADLKDMIKERFKDVEKSGSNHKTTATGKESETTSAMEESNSKATNALPEDDVIVLSDDDMDDENNQEDDASSVYTGPFSPLPDDNPLNKLTDCELGQRDKAIRDLQEELRTEEGKLLLLKKLRQSQLQPVQVVQKEGSATTAAASVVTATTSTSTASSVTHKTNQAPSVVTTLPQLLRTSQGTKVQLSVQQQQQLKQLQQLQQQQQQKSSGRVIQMPQLVRGAPIQTVGRSMMTTQSGPPPLVMVSSRGSSQGQQIHGARHIIRVSGTGTVSTTSIQTAGSSHASTQQVRTSSSATANDSQSAASRQAAAKLALRKQLEKTLLQIPPPKPPPPELHFLPSAANNEFIILVGLEEVVNTILEVEKDSKKKAQQRFTDPFRCAQCKTDFTTIWKQDAKQGIMCETCIVSNQKKSLKAEHTNRLKTAFVKALQQEQEIEQRMQQGQNPTIHSTQQTTRQVHQVQTSQPTRHRVMNPVPHQQRTVLNPAPNTQRVMQPVTYTYIPHVSSVKNSNQPYTYRVPTSQVRKIQMVTKNQIASSHHSVAARQREYLLDMIPSKVLSQNTAVPWKR